MKNKTIPLLIIFCIGIVINANAKIWRVNNNVGVDRDFVNLANANNSGSVMAGDTIMIEGSATKYPNVDITKKLVIIGPGYFLADNPETQANLATAHLGNVDFEIGSDSSIMMGIYCDDIDIFTNNITIKRCRVSTPGFEDAVIVYSGLNNIFIMQSYLYSNYSAIYIQNSCSNIFIQNNFIQSQYNNSSTYGAIEMYNGSSTANVSHNILDGSLKIYNSNVSNNIMYDGDLSFSNVTFERNISDNAAFPDSNNLQNVARDSVFVLTGSNDARFKLKEDPPSPAIGYGSNGEDCGIFGGVDPYVLSGMPNVPSIYYFNAPSTGSKNDGLPVTIRVRSHK